VFEQLSFTTPQPSGSGIDPSSTSNSYPRTDQVSHQVREDIGNEEGDGPLLADDGWIAVYGPYLNDDGSYKSKDDEEVRPPHTITKPVP
jgi:hypothetical protein